MQQERRQFSAFVKYEQPPYEELKRRFPAYVNPDYKGRRFDPIEYCKGVSMESREVAFKYVHFNSDASIRKVLFMINYLRLRPALYEELLSFAEKYLDEMQKHPIVSLGSEVLVDGLSNVAYLWDGGAGRNLYLRRSGLVWGSRFRFLAVPK